MIKTRRDYNGKRNTCSVGTNVQGERLCVNINGNENLEQYAR